MVAAALLGSAETALAASGTCLASRLRLIAVQPSRGWMLEERCPSAAGAVERVLQFEF